MWGFVIVPVVTVSDCLFCGIRGFCVSVRVPLQLFSLILPSVWRLLIVTDGRASSDWSLGPMLVCVRLGDICIMLGSSLVFLVFFVYVLIRKRFVISILSQQIFLFCNVHFFLQVPSTYSAHSVHSSACSPDSSASPDPSTSGSPSSRLQSLHTTSVISIQCRL